MNKYDLEHACAEHPKMSKAEWEQTYNLAWERYYTPEHMETILRRAIATRISPGKMMLFLVWFWGAVMLEKVHPLQAGYLRRKVRTDRRPGFAIEGPLVVLPARGLGGREQAWAACRHDLAYVEAAPPAQARSGGPQLHGRGANPGARR